MREQVHAWRCRGSRIAFVATMGNLHAGHLSLVRTARRLGDRVVASIFVNPLQFGPDEDYAAYPRTLEDDQAALLSVGCDLLFAPTADEMYPHGESSTRLTVGALGDVLCGAHRAGHFDGMATVVLKLLNIVQPDVAVFGQKDFQQLAVIRRFVRDLDLTVDIADQPTVREDDGLAMSSRNRYLDAEQREVAPLLFRAISSIANDIGDGRRDFRQMCQSAATQLREAGFKPDYIEVRDADDLREPNEQTRRVVVLAAAVLGGARLIDNEQVQLPA